MLIPIAVAYVLLGLAGLMLAILPGYASPVFPAAGLALACVLWFGRRALVGVWLGSAILNVSQAWLNGMLNPVTVIVALVIASGATAQAFFGSWIIMRRQGLAWRELDSEQDAIEFLLFGGVLASFVSASVSVPTLYVTGVIERSEVLFTWWNWYVGDTMGVLVFAPLTFCLLNRNDGLWRERRRRIVLPMLVTLCLVVLAFYGAARWEKQAQERHFQNDGEFIAKCINDRLITHREVLSSLQHFIEATPGFSFKQFELFTRITLRDHRDIYALSFDDLITDKQRPAFENMMSRLSPLGPYRITELDSQGRLVPAAWRPEYVAVRYIVPLANNQPAVGYDINSEPIRRDAVERARAGNSMAVTAPVRLVQEPRQRVGLLEIMPYHGLPEAVTEQKTELVGFVVAAIEVDEMIDIAMGGRAPAGLAFQLIDTHAPGDESVLYRFDANGANQVALAQAAQWKTRLRIADRELELSVYSTKEYWRQHRSWRGWAVGVAGLIFAALLQVLMLGMTGRTIVIQRKNEELEASEYRYQRLFNKSPLPMWLYDAESLRFLMVNDRAVDHYGWTREAFSGMTMPDLLPPADREAFADGTACALTPEGAGECRHVRQDGSIIDVIVSSSPTQYGDLAARLEVVQDVTQEKKNRAQLLLAEKVFENSGEAIVVTDATESIILTNRSFRILTGYSAEEARGRNVRSLLKSGRELPEKLHGIEQSLSLEHGWQGEIWIRQKNGGIFASWLIITAVYNAEGVVTHYVGSFSDITQRKEAEEALRDVNILLERKVDARTAELLAAQHQTERALIRVVKSEALFRAMIEQAPLGVALIDSITGRIVEANEHYAGMAGRVREQLTSMSWTEYTHPDDLQEQLDNMARLNAGEISGYQMNKRYVRQDGSLIWISLTVAPVTVEAGENPRHLAMTEDITERKDAEERLRCITDSAYDAILMMDPLGAITYWNPAAEQILGYRAEEVLGKNLHELMAPERYLDEYRAAFSEFQRTGHGNGIGKTRDLFAKRKNGQEIAVAVSLSAVFLKGEWHAVGILRDITPQRELEEHLHTAKQAADSANAAKSEFLANMSHEIRTPMHGMLGMAGLLLDTELNDEQRRYAEAIRNGGEYLLSLLNDTLDLLKIEAGKLQLESLDFDLHLLLEDFAALPALRAQEKGLEFICAAAPDVPENLYGDPGRLRQILTNLATNAVKFTDRGEISVQAGLLAETDSEVVIRFSVRDTGIGIAPEKRDLLFHKFTQADASTSRRYGGTGLGLAISKELTELMGGEIGVTGTEGVGSEFWFTVRMGKGGGQEYRLTQPAEIRGTHILIVDDNATNRAVLTALLTAMGLRVEATADGPSALDALRGAGNSGDPFRAAILDMQMPGVDGLQLGKMIKNDKMLKDTILVLLTSLDHREDAGELQKSGFAAYLKKPVRRSDLFKCLSGLLAAAAQPVAPSVAWPSISEMHLGQVRILLVEDNVVNQKVATVMLTKMGILVDAVTNGAEALKALETTPYDLVLMDVQMPEMDGFETTREIRNPDSGVPNKDIPVIAVTAHAMSGDRERCLQAGMNDYITKPISSQQLFKVISKWLPGEPAAPEAGTSIQRNEPEPKVFDRAAVLARLMGDEELVQMLMESFLEDTPGLIEALRQSLAAGDASGAEHYAHSIKGASANLAADKLRRVAFEMEEALKNGRLDAARDRMTELESQFERLKEVVNK
jgi:PAS domain S-box-containing protein